MRLLEQTTLSFQECPTNCQAGNGICSDLYTYTERFLSSLIALISIFRRPIVYAIVVERLVEDCDDDVVEA